MEIVDIRIFVFNFRKNDVNLKMIIICEIGCACVIFTYIAHFGTDHIGRLVDLLFFGNIDAVTDAGAAFGTHHFDCFIDSCKTQTKYFVNTNRKYQNLMIDMMMMMLLQDMTGIYYGSIYMVQLTTSKRANRRAAISRKYWRQQQSSAKEAELSKQICYCCHRAR